VGLLGSLVIALHVLQGRPEAWAAWAILGAALAGGLLAMLLERPVITLATAILGAWFTVAGIAYFIEGPEFVESLGASGVLSQEQLVAVAAWALLALAGAFAQFATHRPTPEVKEVIREVRVAER
jgi:hypothetical protein